MHLWFIKFGKAISAIQREGLVRGGRRVLVSFLAIFQRVGSGDILFVTGGLGDSARYRTWHVAEELRMNGFSCSVTVQDNPFLSHYADRFSIFVFHRVMVTSAVRKLIERIKARKKMIIFETDDLVYDTEYFEHVDMFRNMNAFEKMQYKGGVGAEILADPYVQVCTTTTTYLADKLRERGKQVFVVPNRLCKEDVEISQQLKVKKQKSIVVTGYFSGTKSHDKDFAVVAPALVRILEQYPQAHLLLAGPLESGSALESFADRIEVIPYVPRAEHFGNVAKCDINIAPLEVGNSFCESKSELKFFEAGIVGIPTVASGTQTYREAITDGLDGFLANSEEEWYDKLSFLVRDADLRRRMGDIARRTALLRYTTENAKNQEYYEFLKEHVSI